MSNAAKIALFAGLAVALIFYGREYNSSLDRQIVQEAKDREQQTTEAQKIIMEKLKIEDVIVGTGAEAKANDKVSVHYVGTLDNGKEFDSSRKHGAPLEFTLGVGQVIPGWDIGVRGMKVGGKRKLTVPPELAYGDQGAGDVIPPNATLHFTVELLAVTSPK